MSPARHTVLVTDGEQRAALAIVRALGNQGHTIYVSSANGCSLAGASRYAMADIPVADALRSPKRFVDDIQMIVRERQVDTLIPLTEPALLAILPVRSTFDGVLIPFADAYVFENISDKEKVLAAAQRVGIAIPRQEVVTAPDDVDAVSIDTLPFPIVVKPARSVSGSGMGDRVKLTVRHAADAATLHRILEGFDARAYPLLLQQRVVGPGIGIFLLIWDGRVVALFSHRRIREKPPSGGVSVYRESVVPDSALVERSRALLAEFDWQGVAMVEYKVDARTGTPYLMEINGRFWGSLQLAIDAGVDFPSLLIQAAAGECPAPVTTYQPNVRSRWWWGDVDHLVARLRRSARDLSLPPGAPSRIGAVKDFCTVWHPHDRNEIFRMSDPMPFVRETIQWFRGGQ